MTDNLNQLTAFLRPLYQDLDGVSRFEEIERIAAIAHRLAEPSPELELLLLFQGLGTWLDRVGNLSRTMLAVPGLNEDDLRRASTSIKRLKAPVTEVERIAAAAIAIDRAGVRGLAERLGRARREGSSVMDVLRATLADSWIPEWIPAPARPWIEQRHEARREVCRKVMDETGLEDLG